MGGVSSVCGESTAEDNKAYGSFVPGTDAAGMSPVIRWAGDGSRDGMFEAPATTDEAGNGTTWAFVANALKKFGPNRCVGQRELLKREMEGKFEKLTLAGEFSWWTYAELEEMVVAVSSGLPVSQGDAVLIFAETQRDWMVTALACFRAGCKVATAYATLGEEGVVTSLTQTQAKVCVCDAKLIKILTKAKSLPSSLTTIVTIGEVSAEGAPVKVVTLASLAEAGRAAPKEAATGISPKDVAVIMYTSGTTGKSKGVCVTHENIVSMTLSFRTNMPIFTPEDVFLAYLPLAHIMEMTIEFWLLSIGASMGYGSPHTLTDTGVKLQQGCRGDAPILKPTVMLFAPAVLDKVYAAVMRKVQASAVSKFLFGQALAEGARRFDHGLVGAGPLWNALVMKKIQALIGGRVRFCASGSAPLSKDVQIFVQTCFNCPVRQGYGCTETTGGSCVANLHDNTPGVVGGPTPVTYLRLRDWAEGNYTWADHRGEILLGGPSICDGYFVYEGDAEMTKKNAEDFATIDGVKYFCTGDIGEVDARGRLRIIDRKKDLFKGSTGEYVALSKVEAALKLSKFVEIPMVYGKTGESHVIALICPQKHAIEDLKKTLGVADPYGPDLAANPDILKAVSEALKTQCKQYGIQAFETPKAFRLLIAAEDGTPAWTPDNDMLTSTMKLKRPIIAKAYQHEIDAAYAS